MILKVQRTTGDLELTDMLVFWRMFPAIIFGGPKHPSTIESDVLSQRHLRYSFTYALPLVVVQRSLQVKDLILPEMVVQNQ